MSHLSPDLDSKLSSYKAKRQQLQDFHRSPEWNLIQAKLHSREEQLLRNLRDAAKRQDWGLTAQISIQLDELAYMGNLPVVMLHELQAAIDDIVVTRNGEENGNNSVDPY